MLTPRLNLSNPLPAPVLIMGAKGMLGTDLVEVFKTHLESKDVVAWDLSELDITKPQQVIEKLSVLKPALVVNAAAYTNVDKAESEKDTAYTINVFGVRNLVAACREVGAHFVHFSTDHVFDGTKQTPWIETDEVNPANYYAHTKWLGEKEALQYEKSLVLRIQWLYGKQKDRFTALKDIAVFTPFDDQFGAPTWTEDIAKMVVDLASLRTTGLYHFSYDDWTSWADVFAFVKEKMGYTTELRPQKTAAVTLPAKRPLYCALSHKKLSQLLGRQSLGSWKSSLEAFLQRHG